MESDDAYTLAEDVVVDLVEGTVDLHGCGLCGRGVGDGLFAGRGS